MNKHKSSYRDPSGFIFTKDNIIFRAINNIYKENYIYFMESGLYKELCSKNYIIPHEETEELNNIISDENIFKIIKPKKIPFITYPYEWCFSQLKYAAILTLKIQKIALKYNMILKDASAYNIQFLDGKPIFIDTLSFEMYNGDSTWIAFNQFTKHFIVPLILMSYKDIRLNQLLISNIDGIPVDLANNILPISSKLNPFVFMNIKMQTKFQKKYENKDQNVVENKDINNNKDKLINLNIYLQDNLNKLKLKLKNTEWGEYYSATNYDDISFQHKKTIVEDFINISNPTSLWDFGANNGLFTRIASNKNINSLAFDIDPLACEFNYNQIKENNEKNILPVLFDLTNPSPSIGWANEERDSISYRDKPDIIMALALIHHLAISNNLNFDKIANYFSSLSKKLIIEFVPKEYSQVQKLLLTRKDIYEEYNIEHFETSFSKYYKIINKKNINNSKRTIYLMEKL